jgi:hypothetical protein
VRSPLPSAIALAVESAIACREINPSIKLENQLAENEYLGTSKNKRFAVLLRR